MKKIVSRITSLKQYLELEATGGILLLICLVIAMALANSSLSEIYFGVLHYAVGFNFGPISISHSLHHWINDGLMVLFFFVVGMEIKKEAVVGELSTLKKASLPAFGALGGMIAPALIYCYFNKDGAYLRGWGIPMATDIAFAVGVLTLLGKRVPFALKVFLLALAIVDDLGAVIVIALFYTKELSIGYLSAACGVLALIGVIRKLKVRRILFYWPLGILMWFFMLKSGVHATIAGVVLGLMTPLDHLPNEKASPLEYLVKKLHPYVTFFIMPVFALSNAGVKLEGIGLTEFLNSEVALGVSLGLFIGKPIGIFGLCFIAVKAGLAQLPKGVAMSKILGVGLLGGIGFTMALFISGLALDGSTQAELARLGILIGSLASGLLGYAVLKNSLSRL